ncbi:hypothetical protein DESC_940039 [Desulfosarcina cetonica]|nr:hypothetical protein DESC_940039 [Desulfosarcina cetonica]
MSISNGNAGLAVLFCQIQGEIEAVDEHLDDVKGKGGVLAEKVLRAFPVDGDQLAIGDGHGRVFVVAPVDGAHQTDQVAGTDLNGVLAAEQVDLGRAGF